MKNTILLALVCSFLLLSSCTTIGSKQNLYQEIGGQETLGKIFRIAVRRIYSDPILAPHFNGVPKKYLQKHLVAQTCSLIGGPCEYEGKSMTEAHKERNVTDTEFYRLVEHVQFAMRTVGLSHQQENRILKTLAPLKLDIVYQAH